MRVLIKTTRKTFARRRRPRGADELFIIFTLRFILLYLQKKRAFLDWVWGRQKGPFKIKEHLNIKEKLPAEIFARCGRPQ